QALDLETEHSSAGENESDDASRRVGLGKLDGKQVEHRGLARRIDISALAAIDALEAQRRTAAPQFKLFPLGREPIEAAQRDHYAPFLRAPDDVGDLDERILQMGGDDLEVVLVKGDELHRLHDACSRGIETFDVMTVIRKRPAAAQAGRE